MTEFAEWLREMVSSMPTSREPHLALAELVTHQHETLKRVEEFHQRYADVDGASDLWATELQMQVWSAIQQAKDFQERYDAS